MASPTATDRPHRQGRAARRTRWLPTRAPRAVERGEAYHILLVCSSGGHLAQLMRLQPWWTQHDRTWACFRLPDAESLLAGERVTWVHHPTTRNVINLGRNLVLAIRTLRRERPDVIVSTGAGAAVPFFWVGRLLGCRTVYLEVYDRIDSPTMSGRLCSPVTDLFLVQWPEQEPLYRHSVTSGPLY
jgi:beta-1,4-N-acetylglucosaminyltransferase